MKSFDPEHKGAAKQTTLDATLIKYGISYVPIDSFQVDGYKYTNLKDAIAQAKRSSRVDK